MSMKIRVQELSGRVFNITLDEDAMLEDLQLKMQPFFTGCNHLDFKFIIHTERNPNGVLVVHNKRLLDQGMEKEEGDSFYHMDMPTPLDNTLFLQIGERL